MKSCAIGGDEVQPAGHDICNRLRAFSAEKCSKHAKARQVWALWPEEAAFLASILLTLALVQGLKKLCYACQSCSKWQHLRKQHNSGQPNHSAEWEAI